MAEGTLSGTLYPRRAAVAIQAYNAVVRALEQECKIVEQEEITHGAPGEIRSA
jgi:hypothetical protein